MFGKKLKYCHVIFYQYKRWIRVIRTTQLKHCLKKNRDHFEANVQTNKTNFPFCCSHNFTFILVSLFVVDVEQRTDGSQRISLPPQKRRLQRGERHRQKSIHGEAKQTLLRRIITKAGLQQKEGFQIIIFFWFYNNDTTLYRRSQGSATVLYMAVFCQTTVKHIINY